MSLTAKANTGSGTDNLATDLVAGEHIGLSKLLTGGLGTNGGPVTPSNPLPTFDQGPRGPSNELSVFELAGSSSSNPKYTYGSSEILVNGAFVSPTNRVASSLSLSGAANSAANPLFNALVDSAGNPFGVQANPLGAQLVVGGVLVDQTANPLPTRVTPAPVTTVAAATALNVDLLSGTSSGWYDTAGATELNIELRANGTVSNSIVLFEYSNDGTPRVTPTPLQPYDEPATLNARNVATSFAVTTGYLKILRVQVLSRFVRLRVTTAPVGGGTLTALVYPRFITSNISTLPNPLPASQSGAWNVAATLQNPIASTLDASAARTTSASGATYNLVAGSGVIVTCNVSVVTGTSPTLALRLQVADVTSGIFVDLPGTNMVARTAVGTFLTVIHPGLTVGPEVLNMAIPRNFRLAWTIGGTTPSFTFSTAIAPLL
jgi:hypothetical protein